MVRSSNLQGALTHHSGQGGEAELARYFVHRGIPVLSHPESLRGGARPSAGQYVCVRHYPTQHFFGTPGRIDFVVLRGLGHGNTEPVVAIEVKTQECRGSTDEKIGTVLLNGVDSSFPVHICTVIGQHWQQDRGQAIIENVRLWQQRHLPQPCKFHLLYLTETKVLLDQLLV